MLANSTTFDSAFGCYIEQMELHDRRIHTKTNGKGGKVLNTWLMSEVYTREQNEYRISSYSFRP